MGECYITRRGTKTGGATEQLGIYPTGSDGRPTGNVTVLDNVTTLSKYSFIENDNVLTIALPENLISLADYCFQNCTGLQNISIPNKVTAISQYCFDGCTSLSKVTLSKSLTNIGKYAFQNCSNLYDIIIPNEIESLQINQYAFSGCGLDNETASKLASLCSGTIYKYAFSGLTEITEVTTAYVSNYYFSNCTNLKKATILNPLSNGNFGQHVFENCPNLTTVILPNNATKLDDYMFYENAGLTNINIPTSLKNVGSRGFYNCSSLTSIILPEGVTVIGTNVFYGCTSLKTVYLPSSITTAINNCLTATSSSYYLFHNCTALEDVQLGQNWNMSLRLNVSNNLTVNSMVAMFNSLKDLTGDTAKTLTLGSTNLAKLTDEQKAIATNKNWTLA